MQTGVLGLIGQGDERGEIFGIDCATSIAEEMTHRPVVIEISDADYRSFWRPCHALEESADYKSAA